MKKHFLLALFFLLTIAIQAQRPGSFSMLQDSVEIQVIARPTEGGTLTGDGTYPYRDSCTITATPNTGFRFINWSENNPFTETETIVSDSTSYTFIALTNQTFYANFDSIPQYTIDVNSNPEFGGTVEGGGTYYEGDTCTVTATPNEGFSFLRWESDGTTASTDSNYSFEVTKNSELVAIFEADIIYVITVSANPSEGGTVSGGGSYEEGSNCIVTAIANSGYEFSRWACNDTLVSKDPSYYFPVMNDWNLVAEFTKLYNIQTQAEPAEGGIVTGGGAYKEGENITLEAIANEQYVFSHWDDGETNNPRVITVQNDATYIAYFNSRLPHINEDISAPAMTCSGESLELTAPSITNAETTTWQIAENADFESPILYEGQPLESSYNGWKLRFAAANELDTVYSNIVNISIQIIELSLTGDAHVCSNTEAEYAAFANGSFDYQWSISDPEAVVKGSGSVIHVLWSTHAGHKQLSVVAQDRNTGCSDSLTMNVNVESYVTVHDSIICKEKDGLPYLLLYANTDTLEYQYQWYRNESVIPCTKQYYYVPSSEGGIPPGKYKVYVSRSEDVNGQLFCGEYSKEFEVAAPENVRITFYPNPCQTNGNLIVVNDDWGEASLAIFSTDGRLMHQETLQGKQSEITVTLPQGIYLLRLANRNGVKTEKIVIQNP